MKYEYRKTSIERASYRGYVVEIRERYPLQGYQWEFENPKDKYEAFEWSKSKDLRNARIRVKSAIDKHILKKS